MAFPASPSDRQLHTSSNGTVYRYVAADNKWIKPNEQVPLPDAITKAILMNGTGDMFSAASTEGSYYNVGGAGNDVTILFTFRSTATVQKTAISKYRSSTGNRCWRIALNASGQLRGNFVAPGPRYKNWNTTTTYNDGNWHTAAVVYHATSFGGVSLFVDGASVALTLTSDDDHVGLGLQQQTVGTEVVGRIGAYAGSTGIPFEFWDGDMTGVGLFQGYAFTQLDAEEAWSGGVGGRPARPHQHSQSSYLIAAHDFGATDDFGTEVQTGSPIFLRDTSGNGEHLRPTGLVETDVFNVTW